MEQPKGTQSAMRGANPRPHFILSRKERFDTPEHALYNQAQVEAIAQLAAKNAIDFFSNLDSRIEQGEKEVDMPSTYRETYYYMNRDGNVSTIRISGSSKADADQKFSIFLQTLTQKDVPLFKDFVNNQYRKTFLKRLSPTTVANYNIYLDRYILPNLGDKKLDDITVTDVQSFYDWMANAKSYGCRENLNADTITRVSGLLGRIFRIAVDMEIIKSSPVKKTLLVNDGEESSHHRPLPDNEVKRIKAAIPNLKNEQQRLYMGLLAYTGMRREEIVGLGWEHVFIDEGYGRIERTVVYPDGKNTVIRNKTKTKYSTRDFIIPADLAAILKPCQKKSGFIIHGRDENSPVSISTLKRLYRAAFKELGISGYNNHDWRTTFGTQLKETGVSSAQIADLMGHADTRMVETTYAPRRHEGIMMHKDTLEKINRGSAAVH